MIADGGMNGVALHFRAIGSEFVGHQYMRAAVPIHRFFEEFQCRFLVASLGHVALQDIAVAVNGPPKEVHFSVDLHEHLVQMPTPPDRFHPGDPVFSAPGCEHLAEPMPPISHSVIADFDAAFMQQILDIAK